METDFIYWRHHTAPGIKVEEVSGGDGRSGEVWRTMATQIYCENGREGYREIGHLPCGAPFLFNDDSRISISHCKGLLVVASLPRTPEATLSEFSLRTAMGIDAERADRSQVLNVRERFLSGDELAMIPDSDLSALIVAWTAKEALYKAMLEPGLDFRDAIRILRLPVPASNPLCIPEGEGSPAPADAFGTARVTRAEGTAVDMEIFSYLSDDCIVTIAYSPKCAKFKKTSR